MTVIKKNLANFVTITRIIGTIVMVFSEPLSKLFFIAFIYSGFSDVLDGFLARTLHIESNLGKKLDSISDLLFYTFALIKIWPLLVEYLPNYLWYVIWSVVAIRIILYASVFIVEKSFLSNHTTLNKVTGFLLFFVPFLIMTKYFVPFAYAVCGISLISVIYETILTIKKRQNKNS